MNRGRDPADTFLDELKEKHRVEDTELLVDRTGYLTALARTNEHQDITRLKSLREFRLAAVFGVLDDSGGGCK